MKVHLLEKAIDQFISSAVAADSVDWYFPHSLVTQFSAHWSAPVAADLKETYDLCLRSEYSQRWWKRENYRPKEIMLTLIEADPELAVIAWKDFANDNASLDGRLSRFEYYCNELLQIHRQNHFRSVETYHHQDAPVLSLYLAGLYPDKYALYPGLSTFQSFCKAIGSPDIPLIDDLVRYKKITTIVYTFLQKNSAYSDLLVQRQQSFHKVPLVAFQISYEIIKFEGERFNLSGT